MSNPYASFCQHFYVNMQLITAVRLPAVSNAETVFHFFEQVQKRHPELNRFNKSEETGMSQLEGRKDEKFSWVNLQPKMLSSGLVNSGGSEEAVTLNDMLLEGATHQLSVSRLNIEYLDAMFGFDMECRGNHDEVIAASLFPDSPLTCLMEAPGARAHAFRPAVSVSLSKDHRTQAIIDITTRSNSYSGSGQPSMISVHLYVRRYWGDCSATPLKEAWRKLAKQGESLCNDYIVPRVLQPIQSAIASRS